MKYTTNYQLKQPELHETVSPDAFNENAEIIDRELAKREGLLKDQPEKLAPVAGDSLALSDSADGGKTKRLPLERVRSALGVYSKAESLSDATKDLYGLGSDAVPDDALAFLGKYNQHWWKRQKYAFRYHVAKGVRLTSDTHTYFAFNYNDSDTDTVFAADELDVDPITGEISMVNPVELVVGDEWDGDMLGKWVTAGDSGEFCLISSSTGGDQITLDGIYKWPSSTSGYGSGSGYLRFEISKISQAVAMGNETAIAEPEWVSDSDASAYPVPSGNVGDFKYWYYGIPFENATHPPYMVKLLEVEDTIGGTRQIELDLSSINLDDWRWLELDVHILSPADNNQVGIRLNNRSDEIYYVGNPNAGNTTTATTSFFLDYTTCTEAGQYAVWRVRLQSQNGCIFFSQMRSLFYSGTKDTFKCNLECGAVHPDSLQSADLQSISFYAASSDVLLPSGSKITVYGVRK